MLNEPRLAERGASALIIAGSLVLLLGMAAIAIDLGSGFTERRQAQSAADFSALAAAQFASPTFPVSAGDTRCDWATDAFDYSLCRGAIEAIDVAQANLPSASLDWAACVDPSPPAKFSELPEVDFDGSGEVEVDCIRFTSTLQEARVVVPSVDVDAAFGRVIGVASFPVSALAEVRGDLGISFNIVPFGIPTGHGDHHDCLKAGANPQWGPCEDTLTNGNFQFMGIPTYGDPDGVGSTSSNCNATSASLISNMVRGTDHFLVRHTDGMVSDSNKAYRDDSGNDTSDREFVCPIFPGEANEIANQTGVVAGNFDQGMIYGYGASERGRIWEDPADDGALVRKAQGSQDATYINDVPLWLYFGGDVGEPGDPACPTIPGNPDVTNTQEMVACLAAWNPGDSVIFDASIKDASRYAFAPLLWENFSSDSWYLIEELVPIYINVSYYACNNSGTCAAVHEPGVDDGGACGLEPTTTCGTTTARANDTLNAVTSFILQEEMVPVEARMPYVDERPLINLNLSK